MPEPAVRPVNRLKLIGSTIIEGRLERDDDIQLVTIVNESRTLAEVNQAGWMSDAVFFGSLVVVNFDEINTFIH